MEAYLRYFLRRRHLRQVEYYYAFVSEGCIGLLRKWLEDGMTGSAEEIARMAEEIMPTAWDFWSGTERKGHANR